MWDCTYKNTNGGPKKAKTKMLGVGKPPEKGGKHK